MGARPGPLRQIGRRADKTPKPVLARWFLAVPSQSGRFESQGLALISRHLLVAETGEVTRISDRKPTVRTRKHEVSHHAASQVQTNRRPRRTSRRRSPAIERGSQAATARLRARNPRAQSQASRNRLAHGRVAEITRARIAKMIGYRAYLIDSDGHIQRRVDLLCEVDESAKNKPKSLLTVMTWSSGNSTAGFVNSKPKIKAIAATGLGH